MMNSQIPDMCERAAEPILSGEWESLRSSDPIRSHINSCRECQGRIQEVRFFGEVFSTDEPRVGLQRKSPGRAPIQLPTPAKEAKTPWLIPTFKVASIAVAACFVAILAWNAFQPAGIGRVASLNGEATVRRFGSRTSEPLGEGALVHRGDLVRTEPNSRLHLRLEESNDVFLNESTEVRLEAKRLLHHNTGETWFEIAKGNGEFEVETRGADVLVLGTSFGTRYQEDEVLVPVTSGRVRVLTKGGEVEIDPGQVGVYSSSKPFLPPVVRTNPPQNLRPSWLSSSNGERSE